MKHENEEVRESAQYTKAKAKAGRVPRLRFQEFRDSGNWPYCPGNEMFESISNKDHNSDLPILAISQEHGAVPRDEIDYNVVVTDKSIESYKVVEVGDFIISLRSFQGGIEYSRYKGICSPAYIILRKKSASIENQFFRYYYKTDNYIEELNRNIEGIRDGKTVSYSQFSQIFLPFPPPEEQRKIAACLSSLDELIAAHGRKLAGLMGYKKGLMQQLFPAEGESVPRMRFREFGDGPKWEEERLGNLVVIRSGYSPSQYSLSAIGRYPFVKVEDLNNCSKYQTSAREYCDDADVLIPHHSVIFPKRGAAIELNKVRINSRDILIDTNLMALTPSRNCLTEFLFYYISYIGLSGIADRSTIPQINNKHITPFKMVVPLPAEQDRIASALSSLDDLIAAEKRKIEELKEHKRGLMQGLFPAPEEDE